MLGCSAWVVKGGDIDGGEARLGRSEQLIMGRRLSTDLLPYCAEVETTNEEE